jgi:hypothetical protein
MRVQLSRHIGPIVFFWFSGSVFSMDKSFLLNLSALLLPVGDTVLFSIELFHTIFLIDEIIYSQTPIPNHVESVLEIKDTLVRNK